MKWIGSMLLLLTLGAAPPQPVAAGCAEACYQQKSAAYQRCRGIPPSDRAQRQGCFRQADAALRSCLERCGR